MAKRKGPRDKSSLPPSLSPSSSHLSVKIILRPNQSLGTTFEYDPVHRALRVTDFLSLSPVQQGGAVKGMILTKIDDLNVIGLKQDDVIFILKQKSSQLREIVFTIPESRTPEGRAETQQNLLMCRSSAEINSTSILPKINQIQQTIPSHNPVPSYQKESPQGFQATTKGFSPLPSSLSSLKSHQAHSCNQQTNTIDPFSTPARRRRLIADITRFLLKQYCEKACEHIAHQRYQNYCAIRIQCAVRSYLARRVLNRLKHVHYTRHAILIQRAHRCRVAREELNDRLRKRFKLKYYAMVIRVQSKFRQHWTQRQFKLLQKSCQLLQNHIRRYFAMQMLKKLRRQKEQLRQLQIKSTLLIQTQFRRHLAQVKYVELYKIYCLKKSMKLRIVQSWRKYRHRKQHQACVMLQSQWRRILSRGYFFKLQKQKENENNELKLMALEDNLSKHSEDNTVELSICLLIDPKLSKSLQQSSIGCINWCLNQRILKYSHERDRYDMGSVVKNLLGIWNKQQLPASGNIPDGSSSEPIEISSSSIQSNESLHESTHPLPDQIPSGWDSKYPRGAVAPNERFRVSINRYHQIHLFFENYQNWVEIDKYSDSLQRNYYIHVYLGRKETFSTTPKGSKNSHLNSVPSIDVNVEVHHSEENTDRDLSISEFEFHNLEVLIAVTAPGVEKIDNRQLIYHIESKVEGEFKDSIELDINTDKRDQFSEVLNDDFILEDQIEHLETSIITEYKEESTFDRTQAIIEGDWYRDRTQRTISRPTTATTRLYITKEPVIEEIKISEEDILANCLNELKRKMNPVLDDFMVRLKEIQTRKRNIILSELNRSSLARKIQRTYGIHAQFLKVRIAVTRVQRFSRRYKYLKWFQRTVREVIQKMRMILKFLQNKARLLIAKRMVISQRIKICDNSRDARQDFILTFSQSLLSSYSWAPGGYGQEFPEISTTNNSITSEEVENDILRNFIRDCDANSVHSPPIPPPPIRSSPNIVAPPIQSDFETPTDLFFVPVSETVGELPEPAALYSRPLTPNHWAERLFSVLELPKSYFQDPEQIDITSSKHALIAHFEEDESFQTVESKNSSYSRQIRHWNESIISFENCDSFCPSFGNVRRSTLNYTVNLAKYTSGFAQENDHIPELFARFLPRDP